MDEEKKRLLDEALKREEMYTKWEREVAEHVKDSLNPVTSEDKLTKWDYLVIQIGGGAALFVVLGVIAVLQKFIHLDLSPLNIGAGLAFLFCSFYIVCKIITTEE